MEEEDICRVCRSEGTVDNPLFYPCVCHGTIRYVHQDCLVQWLKYSKKTTCELCKHPYKFVPIYSPDMPQKIPISVIVTGIASSFFKLVKNWFHFTMLFLTWFIVVPLSAARIYSFIFKMDLYLLMPHFIFQQTGKQIFWIYLQGVFIVLLGLSLFMSIIWLKEQILTTTEVNEWLANPYRQDQDDNLARQQAHRQQLLLTLRRNAASTNVSSGSNTTNPSNTLSDVNTQNQDPTITNAEEERPTTSNNYNNNLGLQTSSSQDIPTNAEYLGIPEQGLEINVGDEQTNEGISQQNLNTNHDTSNNANIDDNENNNLNPSSESNSSLTNQSGDNQQPQQPNQINAGAERREGLLAAVLDIFGFNNIDWDRAVEDLTWENLLGFDGSFNFLEHALWIIVFNAIFIFFFAFVPYQYGRLFFRVTKFEKRIKSTSFELFVNIYIGYILIAHLFYQLRNLAHRFNSNRFKLVFGLSYITIKVALLIVLEILIFPFYCGWFLDLCSLGLFGSTWADRLKTATTNPYSSALVHWLIGIVYVFYFASGVLLLRETLRPGLIWFLRNNASSDTSTNSPPPPHPSTARRRNDVTTNTGNHPDPSTNPDESNNNQDESNTNNNPGNRNTTTNNNNTNDDYSNFNPIKEMIVYPIIQHIRRFMLSWLLFFTIITLTVYFPSKIIKWAIPSFLPYNFISSYDSYFAELPLELILFHIVLPTLLSDNGIRAPRTFVTSFIRLWAERVGQLLGLRSYLLGRPSPLPAPLPPPPQNTSSSNRNQEINPPPTFTAADTETTIAASNNNNNDIHRELNDVNLSEGEGEISNYSFDSDDEYTLTSSSECSYPDILNATLGEINTISSPPQPTNNSQPSPLPSTTNPQQTLTTQISQLPYDKPPFFHLRILALLVLFSITLVITSLFLFTIPVFIGRTLMNTIPLNVIGILLFGDLAFYEITQQHSASSPSSSNIFQGRNRRFLYNRTINRTFYNSVTSDLFVRSIYNPYSYNHFTFNTTSAPVVSLPNNSMAYHERVRNYEDETWAADFQDLYTSLAGAYIMWIIWRYINRRRNGIFLLQQQQTTPRNVGDQNHNQRQQLVTPTTDFPFTSPLNPNESIYNDNNNITTEGNIASNIPHTSPILAQPQPSFVEKFKTWLSLSLFKLFTTAHRICEMVLSLALLFIVIPLMAGILLDLCILLPIRVPADRTPIIIVSQDYLLGLLLIKLVIATSLVFPTPLFLPTNTNRRATRPSLINNTITQRDLVPQTLIELPAVSWPRRILTQLIVRLGGWLNYFDIATWFTSRQVWQINEEIARILTQGYQVFMGNIIGPDLMLLPNVNNNIANLNQQQPRLPNHTFNLRHIWFNLAWPVIRTLGTALALPYASVNFIGLILRLSNSTISRMLRLIYPGLLGFVIFYSFLKYQMSQMRKLYQHIKDERYLVGRKLVNLENRSKPNFTNNNNNNQTAEAVDVTLI